MSNIEVYARCNSHCKFPVYTKEQANEKFVDKEEVYTKEEIDAKETKIANGTTLPESAEEDTIFLLYKD